MGNLVATAQIYRNEPLKDLKGEFGGTECYKYGACRITGWRREQEDKIVCLPNFYKDYSFFAVYDGHGGGDAAEYLCKYLHKHLIDSLSENPDEELALYLAFLTCDLSLREISEEELSEIRKNKKKSEPSRSTNGNNTVVASGSAEQNYDMPAASCSTEDDVAGASGSAEKKDDMSDNSGSAEENDEDFLPRMKREVKRFLAQCPTVQDLYHSADFNDEDEEDDADFTIDEAEMEEGSNSSCESESNESNNECKISDDESDSSITDNAEILEKFPLIGSSCGSTATVVLFNQRTVYIANVGDSRCIASINGRASVLSKDHSPEDRSEQRRIRKAGCEVKNGRINFGLNMSRSFGDYGLKIKKTAEIFQAVTCEPDIKAIDITDEMDFMVVASDGIWNAWDDQDVVDFIKGRGVMELEDICAEMFEVLMPLDLTDDGTGCDNMSMIIVKFRRSMSFPNFLQKQSVVYRYPKKFSKLSEVTHTEDCTEDIVSRNSDALQTGESINNSITESSTGPQPKFHKIL